MVISGAVPAEVSVASTAVASASGEWQVLRLGRMLFIVVSFQGRTQVVVLRKEVRTTNLNLNLEIKWIICLEKLKEINIT